MSDALLNASSPGFDEKKPVQIRGLPAATHDLAKACAHAAGLTVAEWYDRAVHSQARLDKQESVFPPSPPRPPPSQPDPLTEALIALLTAAGPAMSQDPRGLKAVPGLAGLLTDKVREVRGMPPLKKTSKVMRVSDESVRSDVVLDATVAGTPSAKIIEHISERPLSTRSDISG